MMNRYIPFLLLTLHCSFATTQSQEYQWQFIEYPKVDYAVTVIVQSGENVWGISAAEGASIWNDEQRSWAEGVRFTYANYARAYCPGENGSIYVLLNTDEKVIRVDGSDVKEIRKLSTRRQYQSLIYLGEGRILQVGTTYDGLLVKGSVFDADSEVELSTLSFDSVESISLANLPACVSPVLTVVDRISSTEADTNSYYLDLVDYSWREMTNELDAVSAAEMNNRVFSVRYADSICLVRQGCDDTDVAYKQPRALNRLIGRANGQLVGWVAEVSDTAAPMYWTSSDNGATFVPIEGAQMISGYANGVAEVSDTILMFSVGAKVYRLGKMLELIDPPQAPTTQPRREISNVSESHIAVGQDYNNTLNILYDHITGLWSSLIDASGNELMTAKIIRLDDCVISSDVESCYRTSLNTIEAGKIDYEQGGTTGGHLIAAYQDSEGHICFYVNRKWNRSDKVGLAASTMTSNWPKSLAGSYLSPVVTVKVQHTGQTTVIAGTASVWVLYTDSIVIDYPLYGILTSSDGGVTWAMSNNGLGNDLYCHDMVVHDSVVYALMGYAMGLNRTRAWLYRSVDQGKTWIKAAALPPKFANPMELTVDRYGTLYCVGGGIAKSRDMGDTWEVINGPDDTPQGPYDCLATDHGLYVVTDLGLYRTDIISDVAEPAPVIEGHPYWNGAGIVLPPSTDPTISNIELFDLFGRSIEIDRIGLVVKPRSMLTSGLYILTIDGRAFKLIH